MREIGYVIESIARKLHGLCKVLCDNLIRPNSFMCIYSGGKFNWLCSFLAYRLPEALAEYFPMSCDLIPLPESLT